MKAKCPFLLLIAILLLPALLPAEIVTLVSTNGRPSQTVTIGTNESLRIVAASSPSDDRFPQIYASISYQFVIGTNSTSFFEKSEGVPKLNVLSGPASVRITGDYYSASVTAEINRTIPTSQFANTVVIPDDGAGPVQVILESSTDLITWTGANPGTYGTATQKRFFRLRAVR